MAYRPGTGSWNNKGSWKPAVRLPRDGKPCKHERHAQFGLRSVLHHFDYMAHLYARENNGERFTSIGIRYLLKHCKDIETKQPYSRRMLERCITFARENGIIVAARRYVKPIGEWKDGWLVIDHAAVSYIVGSRCVFCGANAATNAALNAATSAATNAANNGQRAPHFGGERTPHANEVKTHETQGLIENGNGDLPSAENGNLPRSKSLSSHCEGLEGLEGSAIHHQRLSPCDLTEESRQARVGSLFYLKFEQQLDALTDGEFRTTALEKYRDTTALRRVVKETIEDSKDSVLRTRADCKRLCERINDTLRKDGIKPPAGWVPTLKALKDGGALHQKPPAQPKPSILKGDKYLTAEEKRAIEEKNLEAARAAGFAF